MKGFKVFNSDWTCRGFQFQVGKIFEEDIDPKCCDRGFHFCIKASDCFKYYAFNPNNKVAEVEALGVICTDSDNTKCSTNKIHIIRELTWYEVLDLVNLGKGCTGLRNSGNYNSGDWNVTSFSNGCFNTKSPKIFLFNKLSDWTYYDWLNSNAREIITSIPFNTLKEKDANTEYQVTSGFLKQIERGTGRQKWWDGLFRIFGHKWKKSETGKQKRWDDLSDRQKWWDGLSDREKKAVMNLPNFDRDIFKEITGIRVGE